MDDITFGHSGHDAEQWNMNSVAIPGQNLMSVNACLQNALCSLAKVRLGFASVRVGVIESGLVSCLGQD